MVIMGLTVAGPVLPQAPAAKSTEEPRSMPAVRSRAEFDSLSVVYDANTPYALPHVLFAIDRQNGNRIYYNETKRYKLHKDYVNGT